MWPSQNTRTLHTSEIFHVIVKNFQRNQTSILITATIIATKIATFELFRNYQVPQKIGLKFDLSQLEQLKNAFQYCMHVHVWKSVPYLN